MTIVASNSITVSNVNDGTITHTAYAYSADGTDGFTTVYPNLNLLKNTKSQSYTSTGTAENISSNTYPLDGVIADILNKPLTITYNYAITNSSGTWSGTIRPTYGLGGTNQSVSNANLSGTHKETITLAGVGFNSYRIVTSGLPAGTTVTITNLKVEFGSIATPYMPSVTEVKTSDYPSYIGTYSDDKISDSTKSTDYTWSLIRGNDGVSPINLIIESSNGYQFKNNIINTTFTAILYQNNKEIDSDGTKFAYIWSKTNSDGTVDTAWNLAHQTSRKSITITNSDVWQRATFDCTAEPLN
jgi:hypothetical protein